jgi:AhpD family alkylhydroperoxidase
MRLDVLEHGHGRSARLFLRVAELVSGQAMDDVVKTAMHRPGLWGAPFFAVLEAVMRGPSFWTPAEREYMGALVSRLNECPFCLPVHTRTTQLESRGEVDTEDASTMRPELAAVLPLLEKMTTAHAIVDALHVGFVFNTVNRMANAFGWSWNSDEHVRGAARAIHRLRY